MNQPVPKGEIQYARLDDEIIVVRVVGRADHTLSHSLKHLMNELNHADYSPRYLIDLERCGTLDSTFMGVMAILALNQNACRKERALVVKANPITNRQMTMLGLNYLLDIRTDACQSKTDASDFKSADPTALSTRFEQIVHMIEAHETLIEIDSGNEARFRHVVDALNESFED